MFLISGKISGEGPFEKPLGGPVALLGKGRHCDVQLQGWLIGREHARIVRAKNGSLMLEDLGQMAGTWVNGSRIVRYGPLDHTDEISIGGHKLKVRDLMARQGVEVEEPEMRFAAVSGSDIRAELALDARTDNRARVSRPAPKNANVPPPATAAKPNVVPLAAPPVSAPDADESTRAIQSRHGWRKRVHELLLETIDLRRRDLTRMTDSELRQETHTLITGIIKDLKDTLPPEIDHSALTREVLNEAVGLGPLEELLADDSVSEIMVNRFDEIFIERKGQLIKHPLAFTGERAVLGVIERIVAPLGRRIDESSPMVDARLKDGSRVNAIIPPLALKGATLTIRKFPKHRLSVEDMLAYGSISPEMAGFLETCVKYRKNMIVAGGTGSGKTTFLNLLSNFIPNGERIITIEDAAELQLNHIHLVSLESRPSNVEGRGQVSIRELVKNSLRMRPDRIVVGECRGGEALDMLQAMNTGHEGSLTTLHANSPRDAIARLETLVLMAGMDLPLSAIREQISSAVDIVVQQTRFACGSRKVTSITEVTGIEGGRIQLQELFRYETKGYGKDGKVIGEFGSCGFVPTFYDELRAQGADLDLSIFRRDGE
ncbi:MAG TPA: ATPase, T2SS/T4P/T4SS family [Aquabacterium sp.]|nr:ATPase, T2SS/T4P/T4SS family [Aquabacterium sp.]